MRRASAIAAWFVAAAAMSMSGGADGPPTPRQTVEQMQLDILAELGARRAELEADPELFYELARHRLKPHFDLERAGKYILGPAAGTATAADRAAFNKAFEEYLVTTYAFALRYVTPKTLTVTGEPRPSGNDVLLPIHLLLVNGDSIDADLRLRLGPSGWRIWDAVGGNTSVVKMYRGDIGTEAAVHGIGHTIQSLHDVAARNRARDLARARHRRSR